MLSQANTTTIEAQIANNQNLELPVEIQLFGQEETYFFEFVTNNNGYAYFVAETEEDWFQGIGLINDCNGELLVSVLIPSDIPEVDYSLSFNYCQQDEILGCTDSTAINYNPLATVDDGSCIYDSTFCQGTEAVLLINNYQPAEGTWNISNTEGEVFLEGALEPEFSDYSACLEDGCYTLSFYDISLPNEGQDGFFTFWIGDVIGANSWIQTGTTTYEFIVGNGCNDWISGCTDPEALNYNSDATIDDGSCEYPPAENDLCADATFIEPGEHVINNTQATNNENIWGECWNFGSGEGEQSSVWYSFTTPEEPASIHLQAFSDGSNTLTDTQFGLFLECGGEMLYCDGNSGEGLLSAFDFECGELEPGTEYILMIDGWNGDVGTAILGYEVSFDCDSVIFGCTDPNALNYNPDATEDDGSCVYEECDANLVTLVIETGTWADEMSWNVVQDGLELYGDGIYENNSTYEYELCLEDGCYAFEMFDSFGDGWNGGFFTIALGDTTIIQGTLLSGEYNSVSFGVNNNDCGNNDIYGCTDPAAANYNPFATIDDGSCYYLDSCNFIVEAGMIDCSTYEFFAFSPGGVFADGQQWTINGAVANQNSNPQVFEFEEPGWYEVCYTIQNDGSWCDSLVQGCTSVFIEPSCFNPCPEIYYTSLDSCTYTFSLVNSDSLNNIVWYPGDGSGGYEGGNDFTYTYENTGFYAVCVSFEGAVCGASETCVELYAQSCQEDVYGCTDPNAINYNPGATVDDGSCIYNSDCDGIQGALILDSQFEISGWWEIINTETGDFISGDTIQGGIDFFDICLEDGCYSIYFNLFANLEAEVWVSLIAGNEDVLFVNVPAGEYNFEYEIGSGCEGEEVFGCTDPEAVNFNPEATIDDGSCIYEFECNVGFAIVPDSTGANTIWIIPTFDVSNIQEIFWDFGDGFTSTDIFPVHSYSEDGPYTLCLTALLESAGTTCEATFCADISLEMLNPGVLSSGFTVNVIPGSSLSVNEELNDIQVKLFPNPATHRINLTYDAQKSGSELVRIYDLNGKVVDEIQFNVAVGNNQKIIDIEHLPNGMYVLSLPNISNQRFIKSD